MRIAFVTPRYLPFRGGVETHVSQLAEEMARQGHRVDVLSQETDRSRPRTEVIEGVTVHRFQVLLPSPAYPFAPGLWNYLRRSQDTFDIVHAHNYHAFPALGAALFDSRTLIFTPHYHGTGHRPLGKLAHLPYRTAGRLIFKRARVVICVSGAEAHLVRSHFPFVSERLRIIPNGVDIEGLRGAEPQAEDHKVILSVGRLVDYKNVDRLIRAAALLDEGFRLVVIGEGPEHRSLEAQVQRLEMGDRVCFLGSVDQAELYRWFRTASVYVTMSAEEAFGLTILEGLAAGARVLASDIPAHREVVDGVDEDVVTLVPLLTGPEELAAAVHRLAEKERGQGAAGILLPSWNGVVKKTLDVYRSVLRDGD